MVHDAAWTTVSIVDRGKTPRTPHRCRAAQGLAEQLGMPRAGRARSESSRSSSSTDLKLCGVWDQEWSSCPQQHPGPFLLPNTLKSCAARAAEPLSRGVPRGAGATFTTLDRSIGDESRPPEPASPPTSKRQALIGSTTQRRATPAGAANRPGNPRNTVCHLQKRSSACGFCRWRLFTRWTPR